MSWYDGNRGRRTPIAIVHTGSGARDARVTIPSDHAVFWNQVRSDHLDVVVTEADGVTKATFQFSTWDYANKSGVIDVDDVTATSGEVSLYWLYFDYPSASVDESTTFTYAAADVGYIDVGFLSPFGLLSVVPEAPGVTKPSREVAKTTTESRFLYFRIADRLALRPQAVFGRRHYEELKAVQWRVQLAGADQAAMYNDTAVRFLRDPRTEHPIVRVQLKGGADATDYTGILTVTTDLGGTEQTIDTRVLIQVRDPDEV